MASCTSDTVVSRSSTTCEIDTFMTVLSSTITNCAVPSSRMVVRLRISAPSQRRWGRLCPTFPLGALEDQALLGAELLVGQDASVVEGGEPVELVEAVGDRAAGSGLVAGGGPRVAATAATGPPCG